MECVGDPVPEGSWDEQLTVIAERLHEALLAHRDGARLVAGTYVNGANIRLAGDAVFEALEAAGLPAERAGWVAFALGHWVLGHMIEEQAQAELADAGTWQEKAAALAEQEDPGFARARAGHVIAFEVPASSKAGGRRGGRAVVPVAVFAAVGEGDDRRPSTERRRRAVEGLVFGAGVVGAAVAVEEDQRSIPRGGRLSGLEFADLLADLVEDL